MCRHVRLQNVPRTFSKSILVSSGPTLFFFAPIQFNYLDVSASDFVFARRDYRGGVTD